MEWDMTDRKYRGGFVKRVSLVLNVIDDFTNEKAKAGHVQVTLSGAAWQAGGHTGHGAGTAAMPGAVSASLIKKADGYFVFMDVPEGDYRIFAGGDIYQEKITDVHVYAAGEKCPVVTVRLVPGTMYALPETAACISGKSMPGHRILAVLTPASGQIKHAYQKAETKLSMMTQVLADKNGRFFIPVQCMGTSTLCCKITDMENGRTENIKIRAGERRQADLA